MSRQVGVQQHSIGFTTMKMTIQEIGSDGFAYGIDSLNRPIKVPSTLLPTKGPMPLAGEQWLISKSIAGIWSFVAIINNPAPPTITGNTGDGTALSNLLTQLEDLGYIVDSTSGGGGGGGGGSLLALYMGS